LTYLTGQASDYSLGNRKVILNVASPRITYQRPGHDIVPRANLVEAMDQRLGHSFISNHGGFEHCLIRGIGPSTMTGLELLKNTFPIDRIIDKDFVLHVPLRHYRVRLRLSQTVLSDIPHQRF